MAKFIDFMRGYQLGRQMVMDGRAEDARKELEAIGAAKPEQSQGFTADQGEILQRAADSGQYDIGYDEAKGGYTVTPKADPAQVGVIAKQGVTDFMGNRQAGQMTDSQVVQARTRAMGSALMKHDPVAGLNLLGRADQTDRELARDSREAQQFEFSKTEAQRRARREDRADADAEVLRDVDAQVAEAFNKRLMNPDGTQRQAGIDDHLFATQERAARLMRAGRTGEAGDAMSKFHAGALAKIHLETAERNDALAKVQAGVASGNLQPAVEFYNRYFPDGAQITGYRLGPKGEITLQRTMNGEALPDHVMKGGVNELMATLNSFRDPESLYKFSQGEFTRNLQTKADARADKDSELRQKESNRQDEELTLRKRADARAAAAAGRAAAESARTQAEKKAAIEAGVALYTERHPNATKAEIEGVRRGIIAPVPKVDNNAPMQVKLAEAYYQAGMAKDMRSALEMASQKRDSSPNEIFRDFLADERKNGGDPQRSIAAASKLMEGMGYTKDGANWVMPRERSGVIGPAPGALPKVSQQQAHQEARDALARGASKDAVNARLKQMGHAALP